MIRLFSSFDLMRIKIFLRLNIFFLLAAGALWVNRSFYFIVNFLYLTYNNLFSLIKPFPFKLIRISHFIIIFFLVLLNYSSLFFFNFPWTSQLSLCFFLSFSFWFSFIVFHFLKKIKGILEHLVPQGCPWYLIFFLFLIEILRLSIRPLTLSIRLIANIVSGHCIIRFIFFLGGRFRRIFLLSGIHYFEFYIGFIQAHIFTSLLYTYHSDLK